MVPYKPVIPTVPLSILTESQNQNIDSVDSDHNINVGKSALAPLTEPTEQAQFLEIGTTQDDGPRNFVMHGGSSQAPQDDGPSNFVMHGGLSQAPRDVMDGAPSNPIQLAEPRLRRKVTGKKPISREKKSNFSSKDVFLVNSWLQISCDPTINTGHKKEKFWERIAVEYNCKHGPYPQRSLCSLQSRWDVIMAENSKFLGYMTKAFYKNPSGMTDAEKV
jgi:hypothetical protein